TERGRLRWATLLFVLGLTLAIFLWVTLLLLLGRTHATYFGLLKILVFHVGDVLFLSKSRTTSRGFFFLGNRFTLSLHRLHEVSGRRSFERQSIANFSHDALL